MPEQPPFGPELFERLGLRGINCGCGRLLEKGWLNTDRMAIEERNGREAEPGRLSRANEELIYLRHDSTEPYPIADECFEWAYSEHFIEHLSPEDGIAWLAEVRRTLRPGGLVRLSTPDLARFARAYVDPADSFYDENRGALAGLRAFQDREVPDRRAWMVNNIFYSWGHRWVYDFGELKHALTAAGFDPDTITEHRYSAGRISEVAALDGAGRAHESIYVEARR